MQYEERTAKILINKAGGNAGLDAKGYRVALPSAWIKTMGISEDSREVTLQFDGESITIRSPSAADYDAFLAHARSSGHALMILYYYDGDKLCTKICADQTAQQLAIENEVSSPLSTAFGVNYQPTWDDLQVFLKDRCIPQERDGLKYYLSDLGLDRYDPLAIIRKTGGRMAEDQCWIKIMEG